MIDLLIFHYHFLPGGVTDVVTAAAAACAGSREIRSIKIVSGRQENLENVLDRIRDQIAPEESEKLSSTVCRLIDYEETLGNRVTTALVEETLQQFASDESVWWVHNYHLGKNPLFTAALLNISGRTSQKMVFQIHDFPECSRYGLLEKLKRTVQGDLYSPRPNVKYTVINSRDYNNLLEAGLDSASLYLLENPLFLKEDLRPGDSRTGAKLTDYFGEAFPAWKKGEGYMLYPVRSIRRKNTAEAALIALLSGRNIIVSLPGVSDPEQSYSNRCKALFTDGLAPGMFGIGTYLDGAGIAFRELIASSSMILSSSVQEGFGYLFLNSLNWGKPLLARELDIMESFMPHFAGYPAEFYRTLNVPASLIPVETIREMYRNKIIELSACLSEKIRWNLHREIDALGSGGSVDFSLLPLSMQRNILTILNSSKSELQRFRAWNKSVVDHAEKLYFTDCGHRKAELEAHWGYNIYREKFIAILLSFNDKITPVEHRNPTKPIYETLLEKFATLPYLRLIYDE